MRSVVRTTISTTTILLFFAATPSSPQQIEPSAGGAVFDKMQSEFADAYNRKDVPAMTAFSRLQGNMVFNAGEWQATLGDGKQYHGYYSALLVREGDAVKIFEETTNVAVP